MQRGFPGFLFLMSLPSRPRSSGQSHAKRMRGTIFSSNSMHCSHIAAAGHLDVQSTNGHVVPSVSGESRIDAQMPALSRFLQFDLRPERCGFRRLWSW